MGYFKNVGLQKTYAMSPKFALLFCLTFPLFLLAQDKKNTAIGSWTFHPNYTLARNAANYPGNKIEMPQSRFQRFKTQGAPLLFYGQQPTDRLVDFFPADQLPTQSLSIDLWMLNHVNMPVGALFTAKGKTETDQPAFLLGYYGNEVIFHIQTDQGTFRLSANITKGWKKYWGHLVGTYDGKQIQLSLNGKVLDTAPASGQLQYAPTTQLEVAGYFKQEPYMKISNLIKSAQLYDFALSKKEIEQRFTQLQQEVEAGRLFPETFHFNAGPYLHYATPNSINVLWETDRKATATIRYGTELPLSERKSIKDFAYIQETTLDGLQPNTPYYYEITATAEDGTEMKSGLLTFGTAVKDTDPFSFCIMGDTESRPHINHRLGEMIWDERPNFVLHLGDVTDGGKEPHKFEWNQEYFTGITPLASRIPMFPVPGNGESDLYWYKRYHKLPGTEAYYKFRYGSAEFFMLNSNANKELQENGEQYQWLKAQLAASTAKWKIVAHHHCPVSSDENDFGDTWKGEKSIMGDPKFDDLKELYEEAGVDIVFYGHVHAYERSWPLADGQVNKENGVIYLMSGGAGGNLEDFVPTHTYFSTKVQRGHHFCRVDIFDDQFYFKMYDIEGRLKDFFELKK